MAKSISYASLPKYSDLCNENYPGNAAGRLRTLLKELDPKQDGVFTKAEAKLFYPTMDWKGLVTRFNRFKTAYKAWKTNCKPPKNKLVCDCKPIKVSKVAKLAKAVVAKPKDLTAPIDKLFLKGLTRQKGTRFSFSAGTYGISIFSGSFPAPLSGYGQILTISFSRLNPIRSYKVKRLKGNTVTITIKSHSGKKTVLKGDISRPHSLKFIQNPTNAKLKKQSIVS